MAEPWRNGIVTKIDNETYSTRRFWIEVPELERFNFEPGQFVTLDLPIHEQNNIKISIKKIFKYLKIYLSVAKSITKRYFTSPFTMRS